MKPILFSTPMVQAILAGNKTMTRRAINHFGNSIHINKLLCDWGLSEPPYIENGILKWTLQTAVDDAQTFQIKPRYQKGDILWVRETWKWEGETKYTDLMPNGLFFYKADFEEGEGPSKWKPSIFMPKEAARIFLKVTDVKVERLQDISEEDAMKEGYTYSDWHKMNEDAAGMNLCSIPGKPILWFHELWESINGKGSWERNSWVWCYSLEKLNNK